MIRIHGGEKLRKQRKKNSGASSIYLPFRGFRDQQHGAVTVFLIMIVAFIFLFIAVFIDYARIAAFQFQTEQLAKSGMRSVMSSYEPILQEKYGLFAQGGADSNALLADAVKQATGMKSLKGVAVQILDATPDTQSIEGSNQLGRYPVFERQIQEDMKYKAPIDFTLEIINRLKPMSLQMKEASRTTELLVSLQKQYEAREKLIDEVLRTQQQVSDRVSRANFDVRYVGANGHYSISDTMVGTVSRAVDIAAQYEDYIRMKYADSIRDEDESPSYSDETWGYESDVRSFLREFRDLVERVRREHGEKLQAVLPKFAEIRAVNEQMKRTIAEARAQNKEAYDQVGTGSTPNGGLPALPSDTSSTIQDIRNQVDQLVLPDEFIQQFEREVQGQMQAFERFERVSRDFDSAVSSAVPSTSGSAYPLKQAVIRLSHAINDYLNAYVRHGGVNVLQAREAAILAYRSSDAERKKTEAKSKAKLGEVAGLLKKLKEVGAGARKGQEQFNQLQQYYNDNLNFNARAAEQESSQSSLNEQPEDASKESMSMMDDLYGGMAGMLIGLRDEFYRNEYAVNRFTRFEPEKLKELFTSNNMSDQLVGAMQVPSQELEYILYGFHHPGSNLAASYGEIFSVRLAIRTMEGLVECSKLGNPLLILAAAILYGVEHAVQDMLELVNKGDIELSKYVPVRLTYKDYLRMFLMLHSRNTSMMSRMLAVIQFNTNINPNQRATTVAGDVRASIRLWFLPGVMKTLRLTQVISQGEVEGSRYYVTKSAAFTY
ncbi:hypothetical protein [Paenibacillus guangzhouensis]|uniref:hypothetical protein n=1 Tax=Paenibacillus guangzhouensis TaxID=1473112 RepID=UPI001267438D|nr:hypothetical protein [Paenibacillus guangzhouensis]